MSAGAPPDFAGVLRVAPAGCMTGECRPRPGEPPGNGSSGSGGGTGCCDKDEACCQDGGGTGGSAGGSAGCSGGGGAGGTGGTGRRPLAVSAVKPLPGSDGCGGKTGDGGGGGPTDPGMPPQCCRGDCPPDDPHPGAARYSFSITGGVIWTPEGEFHGFWSTSTLRAFGIGATFDVSLLLGPGGSGWHEVVYVPADETRTIGWDLPDSYRVRVTYDDGGEGGESGIPSPTREQLHPT